MVMTPVGGLHQCLSTVSRADRLTGSNALNCFNGQVRLTRPPCHVDLKSLPPPAADPPGEYAEIARPPTQTELDDSWRRARELDLKFKTATFERRNAVDMTGDA
jgi:hypothetical protein